jgi:hypothetical protein
VTEAETKGDAVCVENGEALDLERAPRSTFACWLDVPKAVRRFLSKPLPSPNVNVSEASSSFAVLPNPSNDTDFLAEKMLFSLVSTDIMVRLLPELVAMVLFGYGERKTDG